MELMSQGGFCIFMFMLCFSPLTAQNNSEQFFTAACWVEITFCRRVFLITWRFARRCWPIGTVALLHQISVFSELQCYICLRNSMVLWTHCQQIVVGWFPTGCAAAVCVVCCIAPKLRRWVFEKILVLFFVPWNVQKRFRIVFFFLCFFGFAPGPV